MAKRLPNARAQRPRLGRELESLERDCAALADVESPQAFETVMQQQTRFTELTQSQRELSQHAKELEEVLERKAERLLAHCSMQGTALDALPVPFESQVREHINHSQSLQQDEANWQRQRDELLRERSEEEARLRQLVEEAGVPDVTALRAARGCAIADGN